MKMSRVIDYHRRFKNQGLAENLGDGYLMQNNRVFRQIREAALQMGYLFSHERNEAYETFPLLQLETLLEKKVFSFSNNVIAFEKMSAGALESLSWDDVDGNLKKNFLFHEACHGVVRALSKKYFTPVSAGPDLKSQRGFTLRMLLEESCANACELFGMLEAHDSIHRIFFEMNSYICLFEVRTNLKNAMSEIGDEKIKIFMILTYLQANFLKETLEEGQFQEILEIMAASNLNPKNLKTLRAIAKIAFQLSERFRVQTTSFHLRLAGIQTPPKELFNFDFLSALRSASGLPLFLSEFTALI